MIHGRVQIVVLGAGFAGSLMAMVLRRIGLDVVLVERGVHPRFAIGESSTPLANLSLENIARTYDLPRLLPLTEYGSWRAAHPNLTCGSKRGFSFFSHQPGEYFKPARDHANELLVAASPNDASADTHWLRSEVDEFLAKEACSIGVVYHDQTQIDRIDRDTQWTIQAQRRGQPVEITADFLIDATGPGGALSTHLNIPSEVGLLQTSSHAVYSHWTGVSRWDGILDAAFADTSAHPFPCDAAALHHVMPGGWMWVLRFDNGVASAGFVFKGNVSTSDRPLSAEARWRNTIDQFPSIKEQFASAHAVRPLVATSRMQRCSKRFAGPGWAMLPHAGYFLDPLLSPGIAHSLIGIERLGRLLRDRPSPLDLDERLAKYEAQLRDEMRFIDQLLSGAYRCLGRPQVLHSWLMYYFAAAIHCEEQRRRPGHLDSDAGFLCADDSTYRRNVAETLKTLGRIDDANPRPEADAIELSKRIAQDIASINRTGLCDAAKRNIYAYV